MYATLHTVHIPTDFPFYIPPLVVGYAHTHTHTHVVHMEKFPMHVKESVQIFLCCRQETGRTLSLFIVLFTSPLQCLAGGGGQGGNFYPPTPHLFEKERERKKENVRNENVCVVVVEIETFSSV